MLYIFPPQKPWDLRTPEIGFCPQATVAKRAQRADNPYNPELLPSIYLIRIRFIR